MECHYTAQLPTCAWMGKDPRWDDSGNLAKAVGSRYPDWGWGRPTPGAAGVVGAVRCAADVFIPLCGVGRAMVPWPLMEALENPHPDESGGANTLLGSLLGNGCQGLFVYPNGQRPVLAGPPHDEAHGLDFLKFILELGKVMGIPELGLLFDSPETRNAAIASLGALCFFLFVPCHSYLPSSTSLVKTPIRVTCVPGSYQTVEPMLPGSQDDQQVPASLGLSYQAVSTLPGPVVRVLPEDHLLHLLQGDMVAGDVLFTTWLNDEFMDSHKLVSSKQDCSTSDADISSVCDLSVSVLTGLLRSHISLRQKASKLSLVEPPL